MIELYFMRADFPFLKDAIESGNFENLHKYLWVKKEDAANLITYQQMEAKAFSMVKTGFNNPQELLDAAIEGKDPQNTKLLAMVIGTMRLNWEELKCTFTVMEKAPVGVTLELLDGRIYKFKGS